MATWQYLMFIWWSSLLSFLMLYSHPFVVHHPPTHVGINHPQHTTYVFKPNYPLSVKWNIEISLSHRPPANNSFSSFNCSGFARHGMKEPNNFEEIVSCPCLMDGMSPYLFISVLQPPVDVAKWYYQQLPQQGKRGTAYDAYPLISN